MIESTAEVQEAARHMLCAEVRRLFVEEEGALLVGMLSRGDVLRWLRSQLVEGRYVRLGKAS